MNLVGQGLTLLHFQARLPVRVVGPDQCGATLGDIDVINLDYVDDAILSEPPETPMAFLDASMRYPGRRPRSRT